MKQQLDEQAATLQYLQDEIDNFFSIVEESGIYEKREYSCFHTRIAAELAGIDEMISKKKNLA